MCRKWYCCLGSRKSFLKGTKGYSYFIPFIRIGSVYILKGRIHHITQNSSSFIHASTWQLHSRGKARSPAEFSAGVIHGSTKPKSARISDGSPRVLDAGDGVHRGEGKKVHLSIHAGFWTEGGDFCSSLSESTGGRPATDHQLTIDMAKELAMLQRTEKDKQGNELQNMFHYQGVQVRTLIRYGSRGRRALVCGKRCLRFIGRWSYTDAQAKWQSKGVV